jgi:hypothetical protein
MLSKNIKNICKYFKALNIFINILKVYLYLYVQNVTPCRWLDRI